MLNLLADENFKAEIFDGLRRRDVEFDLVLPTGAGLLAAPDPRVLEWAAARNRILLTHDRKTMLSAAHAGIAAGLTMPGLIFVPWRLALGAAIDDLELVLSCDGPEDLADRVLWIPLR